jgi:hypothetical protein
VLAAVLVVLRAPDLAARASRWVFYGVCVANIDRRVQRTRELDASIASDETTRERAGYVCERFVRHADVAIRGRTGRFDVFALPLPAPLALSA